MLRVFQPFNIRDARRRPQKVWTRTAGAEVKQLEKLASEPLRRRALQLRRGVPRASSSRGNAAPSINQANFCQRRRYCLVDIEPMWLSRRQRSAKEFGFGLANAGKGKG